jgi:nucleotide-binding universal stress UspA family protein
MIKKILVPLDGSRLTETALPYAIWLAKRLNASLLVTLTSNVTMEETNKDNAKNKSKVAGRVQLASTDSYREVLSRLIADPTLTLSLLPHSLEIQVVYGEPVSEISKIALFEEVDLIVMTAYRSTGFEELLSGNLVTGVVQRSEIPVLLLPPNPLKKSDQDWQQLLANFSNLEIGGNKILLTLDGSWTGEAAIRVAVELAEQLGATLHLLRVLPEPASGTIAWLASPVVALAVREESFNQAVAYLAKLRTGLLEKGLKCEIEVRSGQVAEEILEYAAELQPSLLIMGTHARNRIGQLFLGSVAQEIMHRYSHPLVLVHFPHSPSAANSLTEQDISLTELKS